MSFLLDPSLLVASVAVAERVLGEGERSAKIAPAASVSALARS